MLQLKGSRIRQLRKSLWTHLRMSEVQNKYVVHLGILMLWFMIYAISFTFIFNNLCKAVLKDFKRINFVRIKQI